MAKDVDAFVQQCKICHASKDPVNRFANREPLKPMPCPDAPNYRIHADLFTVPSKSAEGNKYILVITDAFTKLVEH